MNVTLHFQSTGTIPGSAEPFAMLGGSMTIGRAEANDLVLPDSEKMISSRHCAIEDQEGNLVVIDLSTNGTFLNYGKMALGKTPAPLNNGDILSIGPYELLVEVARDAPAPLADPLPDQQISTGVADHFGDLSDPLEGTGDKDDFLDGLLGGATSGPASVKRDELGADGLMPPLDDDDDFGKAPLPEEGGAAHAAHSSAMSDIIQTPRPATSEIPDDWDFDLDLPQDDGPEEGPFDAVEEAAEAPEVLPVQTLSEQPEPKQTPVTSTAKPSHDDTAAARAFLEGLGAAHLNIPDEELIATMRRLGGVLNIFVAGVRSILMTRQSIKSEFRINQTVISAGANNPLKFSVSVDQAIEAMTRPATKGYLPADAAAREAIDDISAHEVAMMTGMEAALKGVLAELDPAKLSERISKDKSFTSVLTNKKARYWDVFESQYEKISDQAENDFHDLFSKAFASAYQDQLERLKK